MRNIVKKVICIIAITSIVFILTACNCGGNIDNVTVSDWKPSEIYTDNDIESAIQTVKNYFRKEFDGCTLTKIGYAGDNLTNEFNKLANQYNADEVIVLYSSFDVDSSGGDGSLNPNSTYDDWQWILVRSADGAWIHADHGY